MVDREILVTRGRADEEVALGIVEKLSEKGFQGFSDRLGVMECSQVRIENTLFEEGFGLNLDSKLCSLRYTSGLANEFQQWASR